jgi:hypothetical protein
LNPPITSINHLSSHHIFRNHNELELLFPFNYLIQVVHFLLEILKLQQNLLFGRHFCFTNISNELHVHELFKLFWNQNKHKNKSKWRSFNCCWFLQIPPDCDIEGNKVGGISVRGSLWLKGSKICEIYMIGNCILSVTFCKFEGNWGLFEESIYFVSRVIFESNNSIDCFGNVCVLKDKWTWKIIFDLNWSETV